MAIDIGKGTEDVMVFQDGVLFENSIQMIFPSMAQIYEKKLAIDNNNIILIDGDIIAGEPWHKLIYNIALLRDVYMTVSAAMSLKYDLEFVRSKKIQILDQDEFNDIFCKYFGNANREINIVSNDASYYYLIDIQWNRIFDVLRSSNIEINSIQKVLICCQDHGNPEIKTQSVRDYRIKEIYGKLNKNARFEDLIYRADNIPYSLPRHLSNAKRTLLELPHLQRNDVYIMDSSPAVILGALHELNDGHERNFVANIGNGHTLIALVSRLSVLLVYEIHTGGLQPGILKDELRKVLTGELTHDEILKSGGHGLYMHPSYDKIKNDEEIDLLLDTIHVIGPNRQKLNSLNINYLHPGGSMMMAGPIGLYIAYKYLQV